MSVLQHEMLPAAEYMNHKDIADAFVAFCKLLEPDHKYRENPHYTRGDFQATEITSSSTWGKCGPSKYGRDRFGFNTDTINDRSTGWLLGLFTHEAVHLSIGTEYSNASHPQSFYEKFCDYVVKVIDDFDEYAQMFGNRVNIYDYKEFLVNDPVESTIDRRGLTLYEAQCMLADAADWNLSSFNKAFGKSTIFITDTYINRVQTTSIDVTEDNLTWEFEPMPRREIVKWTRKHNDVLKTQATNSYAYRCLPPHVKEEKIMDSTYYRVDPRFADNAKHDHIRASIAYHKTINGTRDSFLARTVSNS